MEISSFIELVTIYAELYSSLKLENPVSQDPDDDKFIACALSANCKIIISGDKDLLDVSGYAGINILKPAKFIEQYFRNTLN